MDNLKDSKQVLYKISQAVKFVLILIMALALGHASKNVFAQDSPSVLYVPLIGITSVPQPLALPQGAGEVTFNYAVKNFLKETPLTDIQVVDDQCSPVKFTEGDDNNDGLLDYSETWRYKCSTILSQTTQSTAQATGFANNITASHKAYATVIVGSNDLPPLVSIINITKVAYPLSLPIDGGAIIFTYKVNNPGVVPLSNIKVTDDKCLNMSSKLGDTNGNNLLDIHEVWIYTCSTVLKQTTTNTVTVTAFANGLKAVGEATITVKVEAPDSLILASSPNFPDTGSQPTFKIIVWSSLLIILAGLIIYFTLSQKRKLKIIKKPPKLWLKLILICVFLVGVTLVAVWDFSHKNVEILADADFGWKFPVAKFPSVGSNPDQLAYSDIRDPGGIPQGLPVRLKIPVIGVDSAIEDALITPDGRMDVPAGSVNVAWFALGPHPGQVGSAVIGGHFGISNGVPFVFYDLDKLKIGDKVYIVDDKGDSLAFVVRSIGLFDRNDDATTVFTSNDGLAHLNLITCEGIWNKVNNVYPQRRVVFTDAITAEVSQPQVAPIVSSPVEVINRSLSFGMRGDDVAALQTVLETKGWLKIPVGVSKGYFGSLTRAALIEYQKSVGLGTSGVFDQFTKNTVIGEKPVAPVRANLPLTSIDIDQTLASSSSSSSSTSIEIDNIVSSSSSSSSPSVQQTTSQVIKSLYATPMDRLITFLLLIAVLFMLFKIIRL